MNKQFNSCSRVRYEKLFIGGEGLMTITMTTSTNIHTFNTRLTALFPGLNRWAGTRKVKPIRILLKQETESGSGISWAICKSAPCSRQITTPAPHHSVFYRPDALPAAHFLPLAPISPPQSLPLLPVSLALFSTVLLG